MTCFFAVYPRYEFGTTAAVKGAEDNPEAFPPEASPDSFPEEQGTVPELRGFHAVLAQNALEKEDTVLNAYLDNNSRDGVVSFYGRVIQSEELAAVILVNAGAFRISPSLAFALCWRESRFNVQAVNRNNSNQTIDRGLFQLNSSSFPKLTEEEFFNPGINAYHGMAHLRWCLDIGGSDIAGLAMYNAGTNRVKNGGTSKMTLDYVSDILTLRRKLDELFFVESSVPAVQEPPAPEIAAVQEKRPVMPAPIRGRFRGL